MAKKSRRFVRLEERVAPSAAWHAVGGLQNAANHSGNAVVEGQLAKHSPPAPPPLPSPPPEPTTAPEVVSIDLPT